MRRTIAVLLSTALLMLCAVAPAQTAGSGDMFPTAATCEAGGDCRAAIEWRTGHYGPSWAEGVPRRTLFSVYAQAGEQILLGSSSLAASGAGLSDIVVWNPGVVPDPNVQTMPTPQFSCVAQRATSGNGTRGFIANRAEELAGAESIDGSGNTAGYRPCSYTAPVSGVYRAAFYGTAGGGANGEVAPNGAIAPTGAFALLSTAVNAWDITVRPAATASTADEPGRVFTYVYAGYTGGNPRPVSMTMYLTTLDGFRYRVDTNGFDPNGFVFYGNREGFLDSDGTPLNRDIVPASGSLNQQTMSALSGGVSIAPPEYPLSLEPLADMTLTALGVPITPVQPTVSEISYAGKVTSKGSYVGQGGDFTFTAGATGTYEIVVSRGGTDFDPGLGENRALRGYIAVPGEYTVTWDGRDNARQVFPIGVDFGYVLTLRGGEYHAPMIDVESSVRGGPSITLENPPAGRCPFTGVLSNGNNCTQAFFDDRAYVTANGTQIGDPVSGQLCSTLVRDAGMPLTTFADPTTGFDSTSTERAFGTTIATNKNTACGSAASTLGDARGLDLWTYFPSARLNDVLDVLPMPTAPVATDDAHTIDANTTLVLAPAGGVLSNDTGRAITVDDHTAPDHGTLTLGSDGAVAYTPPTGFSGVTTFAYTIADDAGQTDTATVTITVRPTGADDTGSVATGGVLTVTGTGVLANDAGTGLSVTSSTSPSRGVATVSPSGGYVYTPTAGFSGSDSFTYTAADSGGRTYTRAVVLTVTPTAADDAYTTTARTPVDGDVLANDRGALTISAHTTPGHGTLSWGSGGAFTYTPEDGFSGSDSFTYTVQDGVSPHLTRTVTLTVTPTAAADSATTPVNTTLVVTTTGNLLANDRGDLTVDEVTVPPAHGTVTVTPGGGYTYAPATDWSGRVSFTYSASDPAGAKVTAVATVTVTPTAADDTATTTVGTAVTVPAASGLLANDHGSLTVSSVTQPTHGTVSQIGSAGGYTYTPPAGWSGTTSFTYTATDGITPLTQTVTVTVTPTAAADSHTTAVDTTLTVTATTGVLANDAGSLSVTGVDTQPSHGSLTLAAGGGFVYTPTAGWSGSDSFVYAASDGTTSLTQTATITVTPTASDDTGTTAAETTLTKAATAGVLANDAGSLTVTGSTQPAHGTVTVAATGAYGYTPDAGYSGVDTFTYTAADGVSPALTRTVSITVTPVGDDDEGTTPVDTPLTVAVGTGLLANDLGSLSVTSTTTPNHGTATVAADGSYVYTPPAGWSGTASFTYTATDGVTSLTQDVTIVVTPTALDDSGAVAVDGTLTVLPASGLLANDRGQLTVVGSSTPRHGDVTTTPGGAWTYTPDRNWSGVDTFTYDASDGTTTLVRTVTVTVTPTAADDSATVPAGTTLTLPATHGVLSNDAGDLTVDSHTPPSHGAVSVVADGAYTYTPPADWSGQTTFTYTATDTAGHSVTRVVTLTVTPDAADDSYRTGTSSTLTVAPGSGVLVNDTGSLTVTSTTTPGHGVVTVAPDGSFTYTPTPGWHGTDTFTYTATDGVNPALTRTVTVVVDPPASPPAALDEATPGEPGKPVVLHPLVNDSPGARLSWRPSTLVLVDPPTGTLRKVVEVPGVGRWEVLAGGDVQFTPVDGFAGSTSLDYRVTNDAGQEVTATMTVRYEVLANTGTQPGPLALGTVLLIAAGGALLGVRRFLTAR